MWCESHGKPDAVNINYNKEGKEWSRDVGYMQWNNFYWKEQALKDGYDIFDPDQNLEYGFVVMKKQGLEPWKYSKSCWQRI